MVIECPRVLLEPVDGSAIINHWKLHQKRVKFLIWKFHDIFYRKTCILYFIVTEKPIDRASEYKYQQHPVHNLSYPSHAKPQMPHQHHPFQKHWDQHITSLDTTKATHFNHSLIKPAKCINGSCVCKTTRGMAKLDHLLQTFIPLVGFLTPHQRKNNTLIVISISIRLNLVLHRLKQCIGILDQNTIAWSIQQVKGIHYGLHLTLILFFLAN